MYAPASADVAGLARIGAGAQSSPGALREVAAQFEALFTQMMLKSMRATHFGDGLLGGAQSELYQDMFDQQVALGLSRGRGLGIRDLLLRQLGALEDAPAIERRFQPLQLARSDWRPESAQAFVRKLWPLARGAAAQLGVSAKAVLAQAALETGWGARTPRHRDGSSSFNLFGIKASADWSGERVVVPTLEFVDGIAVREHASFRAYDSLAASFEDYAQLLGGNGRYRQALELGEDTLGFATALQQAGYATDPHYARKLVQIADGETMRSALDALATD